MVSIENMAFKALRNNGYLGLMSDMRQTIDDADLTLESPSE